MKYKIGDIIICKKIFKPHSLVEQTNIGDIYSIDYIRTFNDGYIVYFSNGKTFYNSFNIDNFKEYFEILTERRRRIIEEIM